MRVRGLITLAGIAVLATGATTAAARRPPTPRLKELRCVPFDAPRCLAGPAVPGGRQVILRGRFLAGGMRVTFRWDAGAVDAVLQRTRVGYVVRVPAAAPTGRVLVFVRDRFGHRSTARALEVLSSSPSSGQPTTVPATRLPEPFRGSGMWIWELPRSDGGDPAAIAARAHDTGMSTVFVKAADGRTVWSQFSPELVSALHAQGLRVCAWQFLYGTYPLAEARAAAAAVVAGADCLVLDPESDYQGRYASAQRYMTALRAAVGDAFVVGLASFPYVDYHPGMPYSVFLGPGGAQVDVPQTYWRAIGGGVAAVSAHTYVHNRIYGVPIAPLGQAYGSPPAAEVARFRELWGAYGSAGISWWSWQATSSATWPILGPPLIGSMSPPDPGWPALAAKARGDEVVWLQQHLASAYPSLAVDGVFGAGTGDALRAFQTASGLPATGITDAATWNVLLAQPLAPVDWTARTRSGARARLARLPGRNELGRRRYSPSTSRTP